MFYYERNLACSVGKAGRGCLCVGSLKMRSVSLRTDIVCYSSFNKVLSVYALTPTQTHTRKRTHTHTHAHTLTHTHTNTHACTHKHTHTHTRTITHSPVAVAIFDYESLGDGEDDNLEFEEGELIEVCSTFLPCSEL